MQAIPAGMPSSDSLHADAGEAQCPVKAGIAIYKTLHFQTPSRSFPMQPPGSVPIEIWNNRLISAADWRDLRDGRDVDPGTPATDYRRYLSEDHHRMYGRPWCIGRTYFEFLLQSGLGKGHRVLDFGCGAGRIGIWLIPYLEQGHYVGLDHHWTALDAFARYEIPLHGLAMKAPRLILDDSLSIDRIEDAFDVVLDCYVSFHLDEQKRLRLYRGFANALRPGGRIFLPHAATLTSTQLAELGLSVIDRRIEASSFLAGQLPEAKASDHWHVIQAMPAGGEPQA